MKIPLILSSLCISFCNAILLLLLLLLVSASSSSSSSKVVALTLAARTITTRRTTDPVVTAVTAFSYGVCACSSSSSLFSSISSTLNEDGDFLITGINDDDYDIAASGTSGGDRNSLTLLGLGEDGDFPLISTPPPSPPSSTNSINVGSLVEESQQNQLGLLNNLLGVNDNNPPITTAAAITTADGRATTTTTTTSSSSSLSSSSSEQIGILQDFLLSIIPTLSTIDCRDYANHLDSIGFDPDCISSCELLYDDLQFMKVLHRRYFWNKWTELI